VIGWTGKEFSRLLGAVARGYAQNVPPQLGGIGSVFGGVAPRLPPGLLSQPGAVIPLPPGISPAAMLHGLAGIQTMRQVSRREAFTVAEAEEAWVNTPGVETFEEWLDGTEWRPVP
jgi:hypothetical protein